LGEVRGTQQHGRKIGDLEREWDLCPRCVPESVRARLAPRPTAKGPDIKPLV
jgi:hypothetical protein